MSSSVKELIKNRKSVRTYDGNVLSGEDRAKLEEYIHTITDPFGCPVEFRMLDAKEFGLSSPVIVGEHTYLGAKVKKTGNYELAGGYCFEKACLYACSLGIGTVMLAGTLNRSAFEKAMEVQADEVLPVASPVGYPAKKRSMREVLMRKGVKADERFAFEKLFFGDTYGRSISIEEAGIFGEALEMVRLGPSAVNKQPWRAVVSDGCVHFYEEKTMKETDLGDLQKVDLGIALAHFELTMAEDGAVGSFVFEDPGLTVPDHVSYIMSYRIENK